jgi:hypothetical protein
MPAASSRLRGGDTMRSDVKSASAFTDYFLIATGTTPCRRASASTPEFSIERLFVGAAAFVSIETNAVVVVPHDCLESLFADSLGDFVRRRGVPNEVAEAVSTVGPLFLDVSKYRFQGWKISVNVTEDRNSHGVSPQAVLCGRTTFLAACGSAGINQRKRTVATSAPASCAAINPPTSRGRIPAKVFVSARATVTAGFANEVDAVNQYAPVM